MNDAGLVFYTFIFVFFLKNLVGFAMERFSSWAFRKSLFLSAREETVRSFLSRALRIFNRTYIKTWGHYRTVVLAWDFLWILVAVWLYSVRLLGFLWPK